MTRRALNTFLVALALVGAAAPALAQRNAEPQRGPILVERGQLSDTQRALLDSQNAYNTQQDLWRVMRQYPPAVGEIIQRDPSLLAKGDYMSSYPALAAFVETHPEIARNPGFYFGTYQFRERSSREDAIEMMQIILAGMAGGTVLIGVLSVFVWLIKTIVDHGGGSARPKCRSKCTASCSTV